MAVHQLADRNGLLHLICKKLGIKVDELDTVAVQALGKEGIAALTKMMGGGLEDSTTMEIVDPVTGNFFVQPGISEPGGTDVPRT